MSRKMATIASEMAVDARMVEGATRDFRVIEQNGKSIATAVDADEGEGTGEYVTCELRSGVWVEIRRWQS